jgi:hypothetical protein
MIVLWLVSAGLACYVGSKKQAPVAGLCLGLLFGPLGVIVALVLDNRVQCPHCGGRLNGRYPACQHCCVELKWAADKPLTQEMYEQRLRERARQCQQVREWDRPKFDEWGNPLEDPQPVS